MNPTTRRDLLRGYADLLSPLKAGWAIRGASKKFLATHGIGEGHALFPAIQEILGAHDRRVGGLSSPELADEETRKVIG